MTSRHRASLAVIVTLFVFARAMHAAEQDAATEAATSRKKAPVMVTPAQWLQSQQPPYFREGHTLPPLTRYGWTLPFDARVEFAKHWGYALEFGGYVTEGTVKKLDDPDSVESRLAALAADDPDTYKLSVICSRRLPYEEAPPETWARDEDGKLLSAKAKSLDGTEWQKGMNTVWSPAAPDSVWEMAGRFRADPIAKVREKCPISIVLNGGEYGIGVLGFAKKVWEKDPRILRDKGEMSWFEYVSRAKANAETIIADAVREAVPDRDLYIYYTTSGGTHRNRYGGWSNWAYDYTYMQSVSDLPSSEHYYRHFNSGWTGKQDMLTMALNARGFEIAEGDPLCYDWLCAGWGKKLGDLAIYEGFLKTMYVAGMIGGNAGYYEHPDGGFGATFPAEKPPHWIRQMVVLSRVHALFSHHEEFVRNSELLPGPAKHVWSKEQPAYEFPTGSKAVRVLARRHRDTDEWLIVAWAAGGDNTEVEVTIPGLDKITLPATPRGTLHHATTDGGTVKITPVAPPTPPNDQ